MSVMFVRWCPVLNLGPTGRCRDSMERRKKVIEVHTRKTQREIHPNDNEHSNDLQDEENSDDGADNLLLVNLASLIKCLHHTFDL